MSDAELRQQSRSVESLQDKWRLIRSRLRAGVECQTCWCEQLSTPGPVPHPMVNDTFVDHCPNCCGLSLRERVTLAAWCGDPNAREIIPGAYEFHCTKSLVPDPEAIGFQLWKACFGRWPRVVMRAALAVAREVYRIQPRIPNNVKYAIEAGQRWVECPCSRHKQLWISLLPWEYADWLPLPDDSFEVLIHVRLGQSQEALTMAGKVAVLLVRKTIQDTLIEWVVNG